MSTIIASQGFSYPGRIVTTTNPGIELSIHYALELVVQGKYMEALDTFDEVLKMAPSEARAFHAKGDIYNLLGRYEDALACYTTALEWDPFNAETRYNKDVTLKMMGQKKEIEECTFKEISWSL